MRRNGVVSRERSAAARVHARRTWTCTCGKVCHGNGGQSSHQRACRAFQAFMLGVKAEQLDRYKAKEASRQAKGYIRSSDSYAGLIRGVEEEIRRVMDLLARWPEGAKRPKDES